MGMDFQDINNDSFPDILVADMLPQDYTRHKKMLGIMNYEKYELALRNNYNSQYVRNTLQLNNGILRGRSLRSSEVAFMKGIASTDWSWTPLILDLDNDADKDIYITNGYVKDVADLDFINYSSTNNMFGTTEERLAKQIDFTKKLDSIYLPNYIYENKGQLQFADVSAKWISKKQSYSNGMAYADFDKDGDLDLVINNINEKAFLLKNTTSENSNGNYFRLRLEGSVKNRHAIGSKVTLWSNGKAQHQFHSVIKGYLSSMEPILHFGVSTALIDSLNVVWPNGKVSLLKELSANQTYSLSISEASEKENIADQSVKPLFKSNENLIDFKHEENSFNEYSQQRLLVRQYSRQGPSMAAANIDGKAGDELFIGGSRNVKGAIWSQDSQGQYRQIQELDGQYEDTDATFVDIDGDSDLDLYVASGGTEFPLDSSFYKDRIYLNDGTGHFTEAPDKLPEHNGSTKCVRPFDFDHDGDIDFFLGSRNVPGRYPEIPQSSLLVNKNGTFEELMLPDLNRIGMVTDAEWMDTNGDGWEDLVVVGEWMPITVFRNNNGSLQKVKSNFIDLQDKPIRTNGWWLSLSSGDFDGDGDIDFLVGNQGINGFMRPSQKEPLYVYQGDYDDNGSLDPILAKFFNTDRGTLLLPVHTRDDVVAQLASLKRKYLTYDAFAKVNFEELLDIEDLNQETLSTYTFLTSYAENLGDGRFRLTSLPETCQTAPINDFLVKDFDNDGSLDALLVGNDFSSEMLYGRHDALTGLYLKGNGTNGFTAIPSSVSGFYVPGQSNRILQLKDRAEKSWLFAAQNNDSLRIFEQKP